MVKHCLGEDPLSGDWYAFINRRRTQMKILTFESGGYCVWSKRLEQGQFARFDAVSAGKWALSGLSLLALIDGVDWELKRQRKRYKKVA